MRVVITSRLEDAGQATGGVMLYQLTNGLCWAGPDEGPEVACETLPWVSLYHEDGRFFLGFEGQDEVVEVCLVACRRRVWREVTKLPALVETC